ncbi:hypothetical protein M1D52_09365 [Olivibacter sp. SA151]|uniref:hypothetical protein n=1 Tax=Olivibacter jilunii TaxID=985016 RepID=UPI003F159C91
MKKLMIVAAFLVAGIVSSKNLEASVNPPAPSCSGSGQHCATATDGTTYVKCETC